MRKELVQELIEQIKAIKVGLSIVSIDITRSKTSVHLFDTKDVFEIAEEYGKEVELREIAYTPSFPYEYSVVVDGIEFFNMTEVEYGKDKTTEQHS